MCGASTSGVCDCTCRQPTIDCTSGAANTIGLCPISRQKCQYECANIPSLLCILCVGLHYSPFCRLAPKSVKSNCAFNGSKSCCTYVPGRVWIQTVFLLVLSFLLWLWNKTSSLEYFMACDWTRRGGGRRRRVESGSEYKRVDKVDGRGNKYSLCTELFNAYSVIFDT